MAWDGRRAARGVTSGWHRLKPDVGEASGQQRQSLQGFGVAAAARFLRAFVEDAKATGFVAQALVRNNQSDAAVAPAAN